MKIALSKEENQLIRHFSGCRIEENDVEKLNAWVGQRLEKLHVKDVKEYLGYLNKKDACHDERSLLSQLLTTGETFFMRDKAQMELIKRVLIPKILEENKLKKTITMWAPACSTGEEVYSLIIILNQCLENNKNWKIEVVGSDINDNFLSQAKAGIYKQWSFRECTRDFREKYFTPFLDGWKINSDIQSSARFIKIDLVEASLPDQKHSISDFDLILCRNLFIYMNADAISLITNKLSSCLKTGGVLMTGHGEIHAYPHRYLNVLIYPESLVYIKQSIVNDVKNETIHPPITEEEYIYSVWHLANVGRYSDALKLCKEIYKLNSMRPDLHYLHALILIEFKEFEEAKNELRKALYLDNNFIPAYLELITMKIQEGKKSKAIKICDQAISVMEISSNYAFIPMFKNFHQDDIKKYLLNLRESLTVTLDKE